MTAIAELFKRNRAWAEGMRASDPEFFSSLANQQSPEFLWIGCSDSRVPANQIVGLLPGELFVHRNVANVVIHTDLNCLSVLQFAIEVLKVRHIMVTGHYGCGGVRAAMGNAELGLIDNWLRSIKDIYQQHRVALDAIADEAKRVDRLCELNVMQQVANVCHTTIVQSAWRHGAELSVHGFIYDIHDGLLRDLQCTSTSPDEVAAAYARGIAEHR